jgi:hypothetical protein
MTTPETEPQVPPASTAPTRRKSWRLLRHFTMQLLPVTAGILIALLIDDVRELRRQDKLVAEAHAAIAAEIAENSRQLDNALPSLDSVEAVLYEMLQAIDEILPDGTTTGTYGDFGLFGPRLTRASWESAERTGALGYMDYAQVRQYASLYAAQDLVLAAHNELSARFPTLASVGIAIKTNDGATTRVDDLRRGRATILEFLIAIGSHRVMAQGLRGRYQSLPCYLEDCPRPEAVASP